MAQAKDDLRSLTGPQKAAIFMLAIDNERAGKIFELMGDEEIRELSQSMSNLGTVDSSVIEGLFLEFADQLSASGLKLPCSGVRPATWASIRLLAAPMASASCRGVVTCSSGRSRSSPGVCGRLVGGRRVGR